MLLAFTIALATAVQVWVNDKQWRAMRRELELTEQSNAIAKTAADASASAAATAAKQLEMAERPWVSATVDLDDSLPLTFRGESASVGLGLTLKNSGHTVAQRVWASMALLAFERGRIAAEQAKLCTPPEEPDWTGYTVFPGSDQVIPALGHQISPREIRRARNEATMPDRLPLMLLVCVNYVSPVTLRQHQSRYAFTVMAVNVVGSGAHWVDPAVPGQRLLLVPFPKGTSAD